MRKKNIDILLSNIQQQVDDIKHTIDIKRYAQRDKHLDKMDKDELQCYIYSQLSSFPQPLSTEESELMYTAMLGAVNKMRNMSLSEQERLGKLTKRKNNRKLKEQYMQKISRPVLQTSSCNF